jgi:exopolyphosphatase / guanosine-5'-triphosphate,3'-diphosphate pyrophosphatase
MSVAVIDIGSNSIKLLVAERSPGGGPLEILSRAREVRISHGIGSASPRLGDQAMERGITAVTDLVTEARLAGADQIVAVATSAVRDASNGAEFTERMKCAVGIDLRILTGTEEANFIGRGLTTDPALSGLRDFDVFDLGGGSLECLSFRDRQVRDAISLPLGCVRLTEKFVLAPGAALSWPESLAIHLHVTEALVCSGFPLPVAKGLSVVGTGGTLTTVRAMDAAQRSLNLDETDPIITVAALRRVLASVGSLDLEARGKLPGLPIPRADVFPVALATLLALAEFGGFQAFRHSLRNLRWGIASEMLG